MKQNSNAETAETRFLGTISASSIRNLLPRSISSKKKSKLNPKSPNSNSENTPPIDPNIQIIDDSTQVQIAKQLQTKIPISQIEVTKSEIQIDASVPRDPPVKVFVRIRPVSDHGREGDWKVKKVTSDRLSVGDRNFIFDSIFGSTSNQEDIFQSVGVPLVKNALAGYNTSLLSYGQSGSGKTYTMWGPPSAMVEDPSPSSHQGIVPRIFQLLFSELQRKQDNSEGKQFNYQCRCSFLEIYNEQIGDLLDPTQRNLEIKDDVKNGLYVENLTEEYVASCEDVTQILIKGLSSRKVGATTLNSKSSRSHIVFNFIIESWCKETSSKCFSSSKTSTVSLVDLAGLDRNKVDDASRQCIREGRNVKKSLSQLGHLVDTLAKETQSGKAEEAPYRNSCLTNLLRESLCGNAKLSVICCISPDSKNNGESLRTLRFGQRVRSIKNEPVINEITENDVNDLSDQIRQLKEELIRAKSNVHNTIGSKSGYFQGRNVRDSLNQLRLSLNRSFLLPHIDNDTEEEVNVDEDDVRKLRQQIDDLHSYCEENPRDISVSQDCSQISSAEGISEMGMIYSDEIQTEEECPAKTLNKPPHEDNAALADNLVGVPITSRAISSPFRNSISISSCCQSPILEGPLLSESPKIGNIQRKSMVISSSFLGSQNNVLESSKFKQSDHIPSSSQSNKILPGPTESLAASLQRGLQIIDYHQRNSASIKSSASFSFDHLMLTPYPEVDKANTLVQEKLGRTSLDGRPATFLCASCQQRVSSRDSPGLEDSLKARIVAEEAENPDHLTNTVPKNLENLVTKASKRETELENVCKEQAAKIEELNQLLLRSKILPIIEETCEIKEVQEELVQKASFDDVNEKEELLNEIQSLKSKLQLYNDACTNKSTEKLRSSLISRSIQLRKSGVFCQELGDEDIEKERQRWTEMESDWISLTDELRLDLESNRQRAEKVEMELRLERNCTEELDDALRRAVLGHARFVEHYAELQEKYNNLAGKHRAIMEGIAEVKKAAAKAGTKGHGSRFAKSLAAELSALRVEREREREVLKKENKSLKIQLRDTAEAVHAAGELLVRLREAEQAASVAEENFTKVLEDNEKMKKQMEKLKRKHKMEMITMKQYLAESRLPESALQPLYREDSNVAQDNTVSAYDDQAWRAEFGAIYQEHY